MPSIRSACMTVSTLSAMISRDTSEKCMPSWPIEMPSETEMVPNFIGKPPASNTPSLTALASRSSDRLHGVISFHDDATPICGLAKSSSPMPTARSMPRAAAFSRPSVTSRLRGLRSGVRLTRSSMTVVGGGRQNRLQIPRGGIRYCAAMTSTSTRIIAGFAALASAVVALSSCSTARRTTASKPRVAATTSAQSRRAQRRRCDVRPDDDSAPSAGRRTLPPWCPTGPPTRPWSSWPPPSPVNSSPRSTR